MPLFTWKPLAGAQSYFVLVARDPSFTNIVDYAFTQVPAYAPRTGIGARTYPDELTLYYWAVLPATGANGSGVSADPLAGRVPNFHKQSAPPDLVAPSAGATRPARPTFRWTPPRRARRYRLQVSQDPSFANLIDDIVDRLDRVHEQHHLSGGHDPLLACPRRADETRCRRRPHLVGDRHVPEAAPGAGARSGQPDQRRVQLPTLAWTPVPGAVSYDVHAEESDGDEQTFSNVPTHAFTPTKMTGIGIFHLQARANFPTSTGRDRARPVLDAHGLRPHDPRAGRRLGRHRQAEHVAPLVEPAHGREELPRAGLHPARLRQRSSRT